MRGFPSVLYVGIGMVYTYHAYPDLLYRPGRLARTDWEFDNTRRGVAATIEHDPEAVILNVRNHTEWLIGLAPGGINTIGESNV